MPTARRSILAAMSLALLALCVPLLRAAQPQAGQAAGSSLPSAESILERYIQAIGGRDAVFSQTRRRIEGTFEGPMFSGIARMKLWADAPNKLHIAINEPLGYSMEVYYTGEYGWEVFQGQKPRAVLGPRYFELFDSADFYGETNYKQRYKELETIAEGELEGRPIWVVRAVSHAGRERRLFFDKGSGLFVAERSPITRSGEDNSPETRIIEVRLSDYKEFGGVLYPTRQVQTILGEPDQVVIHYRSVRMDTGEDHDYLPPADIRPEIEKQWQDALAANKAAQEKAAAEGQNGAGG